MKKFKLTTPVVDEREVDAVRKVLESGWLTEGPVTRRFEATVASYVGCKYAVATVNCTVALELCLKAYKVTGEVLIPDFTYPATALAVINAGCMPILSDVDLESYNMSPMIHDWADAVMPVSWGGQPLGTPIYAGATTPVIIEDGACSLGSEFNGFKTGCAITTCFSFHPTKNITTGEGGVITTNDRVIAEKIRALKNFGQTSYRNFEGYGSNGKMSDINAAVGLVQMGKLDGIVNRRIEMARIYGELLRNVSDVVVPSKHLDAKHTYQCYAVYLKNGNRDEIIRKLAEKNIETQIGTYALHMLKPFKKCKRAGSLKNSAKLYQNLLRLPMSYDLTEENQQFVVEELKKCLS